MKSIFTPEEIAEAITWRRDFHQHPELGFEEYRTSEIIARLLNDWGWQVHRGIGKTGIVAKLGSGSLGIGIRADMDALPITEITGLPYSSSVPGKMHACGHDGHMAMLLLAARRIVKIIPPGQTIYLIFQPAEETQGGGRAMVDDGLFDRFPCSSIFALHNWPSLAVDQVCARNDRMMAAYAIFDIEVRGKGGHAAMPERSDGVLSAVARMVPALQEIPARRLSPLSAGVVSVTRIAGGTTYNVCPAEARISGTVRWFGCEDGELIRQAVVQVADGIAAAHNCEAVLAYEQRYPALINSAAPAEAVRDVATRASLQLVDCGPTMASEDFAFMLEANEGAYFFLGSAKEGENPSLHAPDYDFNDAVLATGAGIWVRLAEHFFSK